MSCFKNWHGCCSLAFVKRLLAIGGNLKRFILTTTFLSLAGLGVFYHQQSSVPTDHVEKTYVKAVFSLPVTYDPAQMNDGASLIFSELVYEGLLRFTDNFGLQAGIAQSWKTSEDGKTITFNLNKKAKFHNGDLLTANDVVISLTRYLAPESKVYKYYDMIEGAESYHSGKKSYLSGIKAIDNHTVQIKLKSPFPPILYVLAGGTAKILPAKLIKNKDFFKNPVGVGPFKIDSISKDTIKLSIHKSYHGATPKIKKLLLLALDQSSAMEKAVSGNVHDLSSFPLSGMENVFMDGQDISTVIADTWIIGFNSRLAPFNKIEVRKAFKASIDNEAFRQRFYPNAAKANGYIPQGFPGHVDKEVTANSIEVPNHSPITITIPKELDKADEIAKFFESGLKRKGWKIKTKLMSWGEMMKGYEEKTLQSFLVAMNVDYPDTEFLLNNFASNNPDNFSGIKDNMIDSLLEKARGLQDRIKRYEVYKKLAARVNDLALTANLFHSRPHYWIHKCVRDFKPNLLAVAYIDYRYVRFDPSCLEEEKSE